MISMLLFGMRENDGDWFKHLTHQNQMIEGLGGNSVILGDTLSKSLEES